MVMTWDRVCGVAQLNVHHRSKTVRSTFSSIWFTHVYDVNPVPRPASCPLAIPAPDQSWHQALVDQQPYLDFRSGIEKVQFLHLEPLLGPNYCSNSSMKKPSVYFMGSQCSLLPSMFIAQHHFCPVLMLLLSLGDMLRSKNALECNPADATDL